MTQHRPSRSDVTASKAIQRRTGATFHLATRGLPERARHPTYVLYAFFRVADEVVDDPGDASPAEQRAELRAMRDAVTGEAETEDPVLAAMNDLRVAHGIDEAEIDVFVESMLADVSVSRYRTFEDVEAYLRGSSVAVGEMMIDVMAPDLPEWAHENAAALAEAFQLTNFIRDVREDVRDRDRIYLPLETLEQCGADAADVEAGRFGPALEDAIECELLRAERRYRTGVRGIAALPADVQFAVLLSAVLYAEHHRLIRDRGFDVVTGRPTLTWRDRLLAAARTAYNWRRTRDPVATFERASAIPTREDDTDPRAADRNLVGRLREGVAGWVP